MTDAIKRIEQRYNPEFDLIPDGPAVTWAEYALAQEIRKLRAEVKELSADIEPVEPQEVQAGCEAAIQAIAMLHPNKQAGWLAYILEGLDTENAHMAEYVLKDLKGAIEQRLAAGRW